MIIFSEKSVDTPWKKNWKNPISFFSSTFLWRVQADLQGWQNFYRRAFWLLLTLYGKYCSPIQILLPSQIRLWGTTGKLCENSVFFFFILDEPSRNFILRYFGDPVKCMNGTPMRSFSFTHPCGKKWNSPFGPEHCTLYIKNIEIQGTQGIQLQTNFNVFDIFFFGSKP